MKVNTSSNDNNEDEPTNPSWPMNVMVFQPPSSPEEAQSILEQIQITEDPTVEFVLNSQKQTTHTSDHHFSTKHYALLFEPGLYQDLHFEIGYYVQILGLGYSAIANNKDSVTFVSSGSTASSGPYVPALNKHNVRSPIGLCLDTFWRSGENFALTSSGNEKDNNNDLQWAVSQAAPLRRIHVGNLTLGDGPAYSSGGFLSNAKIDQTTNFVANQQWFSRNCEFGKPPTGGAWNLTYSGCTGNVPSPSKTSSESDLVITVDHHPRVRMEKPFIVKHPTTDEYELVVPRCQYDHGPRLEVDSIKDDIRSFRTVKVGKPFLPTDTEGNYVEHNDETYNVISQRDVDLTEELQHALDAGKDLVLCPGIFFLTKSLIVKHENQVILGLGLPVLVAPKDGSPCIRVLAQTQGVRIAGIMLEASSSDQGTTRSKPDFRGETCSQNEDGICSLLEFGEPNTNNEDPGDATNPGLLADIFARVGGSNLERQSVSTDVMICIHSGHVVGDNLWLWRADHVRLRSNETPNFPELPDYHQIRMNECQVKTCLQVFGNDVIMYGLFCEHSLEHQCLWMGERGTTIFYQCELPYDIVHPNYSHVGYYVHPRVKQHVAKGIGVYSNFQLEDVHAIAGIVHPTSNMIDIEHPFVVHLDNKGGIECVVLQIESFSEMDNDETEETKNDNLLVLLQQKQHIHKLGSGVHAHSTKRISRV